MNQLFDFLPIALFVAVFFMSDIFYATGALMIGVTLQVGIYKLLGRTISKELLITFWVSLLFGGLTLAFRNEAFIQWKPTIVNWLFCVSLIGSHFIGQQNLLRRLLGHQLSLTEEVWVKLNFGWAFGFFFAGALNLVVAYNFSMEFWVSYKLIGGFALTLLYIMLTLAYLASKGFLNEEAMATSAPAAAASAPAAAASTGAAATTAAAASRAAAASTGAAPAASAAGAENTSEQTPKRTG